MVTLAIPPTGQGDITDPEAWQDNNGNVPPLEFQNVPQNVNFPLNGDGRYWFKGNFAADAEPYTTLLMHFDGGDGSNVFTDSMFGTSVISEVDTSGVVTSPGASQSSTQKKFGASSFKNFSGTFGAWPFIKVPYAAGSALDLVAQAAWTVEFWTYPVYASGETYFTLNGRATPLSNNTFQIERNSGSNIVFSGPTLTTITSTATVTSATWNHVAVVMNAGVVTIYVNGVADNSHATVLLANTNPSPYLAFANGGGGNFGGYAGTFGYIDEARISDSARYTATFSVPTGPFPSTLLTDYIVFIGNPSYMADTIALNWQLTALSNDGSAVSILYSTDGGVTFTSTTLPGPLQGLQSGQILVDLIAATGIQIGVEYAGGTYNPSATNSEVAISVTRNINSAPVWDYPNPFDPINYNGQVIDTPGYDDLLTLQTRMLVRLGFANQTADPPPGMAALLQEFLQSAQNYLYRRYSATRTRRWFRWKVNPGQRFYSLLDNDENILQDYTMDPEKTVIYAGIQDSRNVWYPLIEGIPAQLYTMLAKPWRPARYEIRNAIELYPAPDQTYFLWVKGHFGLQSFSNPTDLTTIDSELVFLHALANAKSHYGQPDANNIEAQANAFRAELVASSHKTAHYIPGTIPIPPAIRPTLIQFQDNQSG